MNPKFEDNLNVKTSVLSGIPSFEELKTWKDVPSSTMKNMSFKDKQLKSREGFSIETSNRFEGLAEEGWGPIIIEQAVQSPAFNIQCKLKSEDYLRKNLRNEIKSKKNKTTKNKKRKSRKDKTFKEAPQPASPCSCGESPG